MNTVGRIVHILRRSVIGQLYLLYDNKCIEWIKLMTRAIKPNQTSYQVNPLGLWLFCMRKSHNPRGSALKMKALRLFPSEKFTGVFSGLRQVNKLSDGVKRVVFRYRWECFGCFIEEGAFFWGVGRGVLVCWYLWFMGVLEDHDCESTLFWFIFGLEAKSGVWKGRFRNTMWQKGGVSMRRGGLWVFSSE